VAYDNVRSITIKTVWASLKNLGGIALHALEEDNIAGKCPKGKPFRLLRAIAEAQVCNMCSSRTKIKKQEEEADAEVDLFPATLGPSNNFELILPASGSKTNDSIEPETKNSCSSQKLIVSCIYELPKSRADDQLEPGLIPYGQCDELVIDETVLNGKGELRFSSVLKADEEMAEIVKMASKAKVKSVVATIHCRDMDVDDFNQLITERREELVKSLVEHIRMHNFTGVQLRCDHVTNDKTKEGFKDFLSELHSAFLDIPDGVDCPSTISIRLPVWRTNLTERYDIDALKSLNKIVMEASHLTVIRRNQTQLLNPLYAKNMEKSHQSHVQDTTLNAWIEAGIRSEQVLLQIPIYGIKQILTQHSQGIPKPGDPASKSRIQIVTQKQICKFIGEPGCTRHVLYDFISEYATTGNEWISFEGKTSATYKVKYAIKNMLGGVILNRLNDEDYIGECHEGKFPLLNSITRANCKNSG